MKKVVLINTFCCFNLLSIITMFSIKHGKTLTKGCNLVRVVNFLENLRHFPHLTKTLARTGYTLNQFCQRSKIPITKEGRESVFATIKDTVLIKRPPNLPLTTSIGLLLRASFAFHQKCLRVNNLNEIIYYCYCF